MVPALSGSPARVALCLHTIILDPSIRTDMDCAFRRPGAFRSDDSGESWKPINKGLRSQYIPDQDAEVGHCVHTHRNEPEASGRAFYAETLGRDALGHRW